MVRKNTLLVALGLLAMVLSAGVVTIRLLIAPETFAPRIEAMVHRSTGLTLHLDGPIRLRLIPWLGLDLEKARLEGVAGFDKDPFLRVERVTVKAHLIPLLRGSLEAEAIRLQGLDLTLIRAADGRCNWRSLPIRQVSLENDEVVVRTDARRTAFPFRLGGVLLRDGRITFEDRAAGNKARVIDLELTTDRIAPGLTSPVSLRFTAQAERPEARVTTTLTGKLTVVPNDLFFSFDEADLALDAASSNLPFRRLHGTGRANITVRGQDGRLEIRGLTLAATAAGGLFPSSGETIKVTGNLAYDATAASLTMAELGLSGLGLTTTGRLEATVGRSEAAPRFVWQFATNTFNPRSILAFLGIRPEGLAGTALTSLETKGRVVFSPSFLGLDLPAVRLDGQHIVFSAEMTDFAKPVLRFALTADSLDLDRYLPAGGQGKRPEGAAGAAAPRLGRTARLDGSLAVARLRVKGLEADNVRATVQAADGVLAVSPVACRLAGGDLSGSLTVDTGQTVPQWRLDATAAGVALAPVLTGLSGRSSPVSGRLFAKAGLSAQGTTGAALLGSLAGPVSLRLDQATVDGFSVSPGLLASLKGLVGLVELNPAGLVAATGAFGQALAASRHGSLAISRASAGFRCQAGQATTRDILVQVDRTATVTGGGTVDLGHKRLHLELLADVVDVGAVPLVMEGPLAAPHVNVDKAALAKRAVRKLPATVGRKVRESGSHVLDSVKGFFGGDRP